MNGENIKSMTAAAATAEVKTHVIDTVCSENSMPECSAMMQSNENFRIEVHCNHD